MTYYPLSAVVRRSLRCTVFATIWFSFGPGASAAVLSLDVRRMIDTAAAASDDDALETVADIARKAYPDSVVEINKQVAVLRRRRAMAQQAGTEHLRIYQGITGQGEAGFNQSSGNTRTTGIALGLAMAKTTARWDHALNATADYQRSDGAVSKEREYVEYQGNLRLNQKSYFLGVLSWERDRFAGYVSRFTQSVGLGHKIVDRPRLKIGVEAGPALRETQYRGRRFDPSIAWRAASNATWTVSPGATMTQVATAYIESENTTLASTTALTIKISRALSGRASFVVRHESDPPADLEHLDLTSRLTLVYGF